MSHKPYSAYTAEEFALDDLFVRWVQHPNDEEVVAYWQVWLAHNPHCAETVEVARELIQTASRADSSSLSADEVSSVWGRIRESFQTMEEVRPLQPDVRAVIGWWYFIRTAAATLGVVLLIGWALWIQYGPDQSIKTIRTTAGPPRIIDLPDGSTVRLHANSQLRYDRRGFSRQLSEETPRAVWLEGEADFSVMHRADTSSSRLFRVHTPDLTVEALGTTFRVQQGPECTRVALTSGRVNLLLNQQKPIQLNPGDSVEVAAGSIQTLP
ncbi:MULTISPECIES: FecR family protein [Spirosoma]|uniref:FecR domain-containing protein n=1 Tax=Spirosoma liriopis TaxID=2937440 RepID=A0ABT0HLD3_9BACT|nr:FecR domain-containing protein [Spirosoma oryzicola]MCK8492973.1 FecR domain-containing protein [Spirosoma liriopis]UHG92373.1 FecR domain-containing protein [Spirosoma oryzicola]